MEGREEQQASARGSLMRVLGDNHPLAALMGTAMITVGCVGGMILSSFWLFQLYNRLASAVDTVP